MITIVLGRYVSISADFQRADLSHFDPSTATLELKAPNGAITDPSADVERVDVGRYRVRVQGTAVGTWKLRWRSCDDSEYATAVASWRVVADPF